MFRDRLNRAEAKPRRRVVEPTTEVSFSAPIAKKFPLCRGDRSARTLVLSNRGVSDPQSTHQSKRTNDQCGDNICVGHVADAITVDELGAMEVKKSTNRKVSGEL